MIIIANIIEYFCARHYAKCFICIYSFNPPSILVRFTFGSATDLHFTNVAWRGYEPESGFEFSQLGSRPFLLNTLLHCH